MKILEQLKLIFNDLFRSPLSELEGYQLLILAGVAVILFFLFRGLGRLIGSAFKKIGSKTKKKISYTEKCKQIQCRHCGRTLDKCQCQKNQGHGSFYRYRHWKKENKKKQ